MNNEPVSKTLYLYLAAASLLSFLPAIVNNFALDDFIHIVNNPALLHPRSLAHALLAPMFPGNLYRPITLLSNGLLALGFGHNPLPYHALNILLHTAVTVLLFAVLQRLIPPSVAFASVLLWCVLPVHAEVVANVTGRAELLAATFGLAAVFTAQRSSRATTKPCWLLAVLCAVLYALSMGSKESGMLWGVLILYSMRNQRVLYGTALLTAVVLCASLRLYVLHANILPASTTSTLDNPLLMLDQTYRSLTALILLGRYITITFVPFGLGSDYSYGALLPSSNTLWIAGYGAVLAGAVYLAMRRTEVRPGLLWFIGAFTLTCNVLFPIGTLFGERLLYVPSMGLALGVAAMLSRVGLSRAVPYCALVYGGIAWWYIPVWRDNTTLFTHQMEVSPKSAKTQLNFGIMLRNQGDLEQSQSLIRSALVTFPPYADAAYGLASIYAQKGIASGSEHWLHEALKINPAHVPSLQLLGRMYANRGDIEHAQTLFKEALALDANNIEALNGTLALAIGRGDEEVIRELSARLMQLAPDNKEFLDLTSRYRDQKKTPS